jgi:hypothetical protein
MKNARNIARESELMPMPRTPIVSARFARRAALIALSILPMITASSCKKAPPAAPAAVSRGAAPGAIPAIQPSGDSFNFAAWRQSKALAEQNVSVAAGNTFAHVTYKPEVKVVEQAAADNSLVGLSGDGHGAIFENAPEEIRSLKAGDILLVKNEYAVKILGAETDGDQTVLILDSAKLSEVVESGEINLEPSITFTDRPAPQSNHRCALSISPTFSKHLSTRKTAPERRPAVLNSPPASTRPNLD